MMVYLGNAEKNYWILVLVCFFLSGPARGEAYQPNPNSQSDFRGQLLTRMVLVPGGTFLMGSEQGDPNETPIHPVIISPFYLGRYEITCREFQEFLRENPQWLREPRIKTLSPAQYLWRRCYLHNWDGLNYPPGHAEIPVTGIDWSAASAFAAWAGGRLPSEAEWEFAARGGLEGLLYPWGDEIDHSKANYLDDQAWIRPYVKKDFSGSDDSAEVVTGGPNQTNTLSPSGSYSPNTFGLYDISGNAWEWCQDWYGQKYYEQSPALNPSGPAEGEYHVIRGGSYIDFCFNLRCSCRFFVVDGWNVGQLVGFRVAMSVKQFARASASFGKHIKTPRDKQ